jgi:hypothetical protein
LVLSWAVLWCLLNQSEVEIGMDGGEVIRKLLPLYKYHLKHGGNVRLSLGPSGGFSFKFTKFQICNSRSLQSFSKWDSECRNNSLISYDLFMQSSQLPLTSSCN